MATINKQLKVVSNSSPLINLAIIDQFHLLESLFSTILIPDTVWQECVIDGKGKSGTEIIEEASFIRRMQPTNTNLIKLLRRELDEGESEAIALAIEIQADLVLLDERDARDIADIYGLNMTGVAGILLSAKREGYISSVRKYLDLLQTKASFRISRELYNQILRSSNENQID
jgi:predicted nucleic acid-binding protein